MAAAPHEAGGTPVLCGRTARERLEGRDGEGLVVVPGPVRTDPAQTDGQSTLSSSPSNRRQAVPVEGTCDYRTGVLNSLMSEDELFSLIAGERRRAADLFDQLDEEQLGVQSLCTAWTVHDVAGHLVAPFCVSIPRFALGLVFAGGFDKYSVKVARKLGQKPIGMLTALLRKNAESHFTPPGNGPMAPLTDISVHTRDVARPLGLDVSAPLSTWKVVLTFLTSPTASRGFVPKGRTSGLHVRATDQDWSCGDGAEVQGPSEALALAILGRPAAYNDLSGDGVALLRSRLD